MRYSRKNLVVGFVIVAVMVVTVQTYLSSVGQRVPEVETKAYTMAIVRQKPTTPIMFKVISFANSNDGNKLIRQNPLPAAQVQRLQDEARKYDLVLVDAYWEVNGQVVWNPVVYQTMRAVNPDIILMDYANPRNWAGDVFSLSEIPESWYLHDPVNDLRPDARLVSPWWPVNRTPGAYNEWMFDMGNPDFQRFFANKVVYALGQGSNGIWMDNSAMVCNVMVQDCQLYRYSDGAAIVATNPRTNRLYTEAEWNKEPVNMAKAVRVAIDTAFPAGKTAGGYPIVITSNAGGVGDRWIRDLVWPIVDQYKGVLTEGGRLAPPSLGMSANYWLNTWWPDNITGVQEVMRRNMPYIYLGKPCSSPCNTPWPGSSRLLFTYASILLAAGKPEDKLFFRYSWDTNWINWPGYDVDIGYASGDYFKWPGTNNVYARWFDKALVLVNPSGTAETVNPGVTYKPFVDYSDKNSNGVMDWRGLGSLTDGPVSVFGYEAAILVLDKAVLTPALSLTPTPTRPPASITPVILHGDINGDRFVDALDYVLLFESFARRAGDAFYNPKADIAPVGGDGVVNALDYVVLFENFGKMK